MEDVYQEEKKNKKKKNSKKSNDEENDSSFEEFDDKEYQKYVDMVNQDEVIIYNLLIKYLLKGKKRKNRGNSIE